MFGVSILYGSIFNMAASVNFNISPPSFSLQYMKERYSLEKCSKEEKASFADQ
jgi:hypothetical protein